MIQDRLKELVANPPPEGKVLPVLRELAEELGCSFMYLRKEYYAIRRKQGNTPQPNDPGKTEFEFLPDGSARFNGTSDKPIRTKEEALAVCQADMSLYDVEAWGVKSWGTSMKLTKWSGGKKVAEDPHYQTNYAVWIKFKPKDDTAELIAELRDEVMSWKPQSIKKISGTGVGVINLADFHIGADIKELIRTLDFDVNILQDRLAAIAATINAKGYKAVHVNMLGDFIESFTGLNHINSWRSMDKKMVGSNVIQVATKILSTFLNSINNLEGVNIVAGNHDRTTPDSKIDNVGEVAGILAYTLSFTVDCDIDYNPFLLSKEIDGIWYVLTHGHSGASQKDAGKFLFEHGNNAMYNILLMGHTHTRKSIKTYKKQFYTYESVQVVSMDDLNYRRIVIPPLFTGNFWSETMGFASNPGFLEITNNGFNRPIITDYSS